MPQMRALSMSILLAPNTVLNGPLMIIPGSHRKYLTCVGETPEDHYRSSLKKQEYGVPDEDSLAELAAEHGIVAPTGNRSEEHTSELQSLMRIPYAVFCLTKNT